METDTRSRKFHSLSLKDLVEARDQYHAHLINKRNVIATAVGRYLIRTDDPWPNERGYQKSLKRYPKPARTLARSPAPDLGRRLEHVPGQRRRRPAGADRFLHRQPGCSD